MRNKERPVIMSSQNNINRAEQKSHQAITPPAPQNQTRMVTEDLRG
jgi:hypothetical protein